MDAAEVGRPALFVIGHGTRDATGVAEFGELLATIRSVPALDPDRARTRRAPRPGGFDGIDGSDAATASASSTSSTGSTGSIGSQGRRGSSGTGGPGDGPSSPTVAGGFIELADPHVDVALDDLVATGATDIVAVPYVLFGAGHLKDDGPATLERARRRHPGVRFRLGRDLGVHPLVLDVAEQRAAAALGTAPRGRDATTAVVLVSRGSTDPDAIGEFVKFARLLQDGRGLGEVHPAFVAMAQPDVAGALDRAARLGADTIAVVPLFLFAGVLVDRIAEQAAAWAAGHPEVSVTVAPHLGVDGRLAELVVERYAEVGGGDVRMNCDVCSYRVRLPGYEDKVALPLPLAPHGTGAAKGWRARRAAAQAENDARTRRERPRFGLGRALPVPPAGDLGGRAAIEVSGLTFAHPDGQQVLNGVDLTVAAGERIAVLGPNGAGKTTLVLHLLGVHRPRTGTVRVAGLDATADVDAVRRLVGLVFQDPDDQLFSPTVRADVAFGPAHLGLVGDELDERVAAALDAVGLADVADRAPHHLSIGQRRRAALATVLAMHPKVLVLDEPTANLDPAARRDLADIVAGLDLTIVVVTHDLSFAAELCPRAVVLDSGVVAADGPTDALLASPATMAAHRLELPFGFTAPRP